MALSGLLAVLFTTLGGNVLPVVADGGPTFPVMNTSETLPDGVYFRSDTHTADAIRITGFGVYRGESIQANCWSWGDAVGPYSNHIWYQAANMTRPTVSGQANAGWINTHYVSDNMTADHANPAVPQCGSVSTPPPPTATPIPTPPPPTSAPVTAPNPVTPPVANTPPPTPTQQTQGSGPQGGPSSAVQNPTRQPIQGSGGPLVPPGTPIGASVYYSPFGRYAIAGVWAADYIWRPCGPVVLGHSLARCPTYAPAPAHKTLYYDDWSGVGGSNAGKFDDVIENQPVTTLAGWSIGRMGPIYFLDKYPSRASNIHYIVLFDPGSYDELSKVDCADIQDCSTNSVSRMFARWLGVNPKNRLVIVTGADTYEGGQYTGLKKVYFPAIHSTAQANQVTVCSYGRMGHEDVWINFRGLVATPFDSCPAAAGGATAQVWHA